MYITILQELRNMSNVYVALSKHTIIQRQDRLVQCFAG